MLLFDLSVAGWDASLNGSYLLPYYFENFPVGGQCGYLLKGGTLVLMGTYVSF